MTEITNYFLKIINNNVMTRIFLVLLVSILAMTGFAQTTVEINGANSLFLSAHSFEDSGLRVISRPKNGNGTITLDSLKKESLILIGANNDAFFLWMSPGDKIVLDCTTGGSTGGNQKINGYLNSWKKKYLINNTLQYNYFLTRAMAQVYKENKVEDYFADDYVEKLQTSTKIQLQGLKKEKIKNKEFTSYFSNLINSNYWLSLIRADRFITYKEQTTPPAIFKALLEMDIDEPILQQKDKSEMLTGYIRGHEGLKNIEPTYQDYIYQKAKVIKNEKVRESYILDELQQLITRSETLFVKELFESSKPLLKSADALKKYDERYANIKADEFAGKPAVELNAVGLDGAEKKLSDFKGKYIYIDVWATWCGPCKQMTPFFMKLADQYKGKDVVFLSLSADKVKDEQNWKDYVAEHFSDNCVPVWTGSDFKNDFIREYKINAIPRFLMIDPQGNIYSSKFWRPNDPRVPALINKLLEQNQ